MSTYAHDKTDKTKHQHSRQNSDKTSEGPDVSELYKAKYTATRGDHLEKANKLIGRVSKYISAWTSVSEGLRTNTNLPRTDANNIVGTIVKQINGWESLKNALQRIKDLITSTTDYNGDTFKKACGTLDSLESDIDKKGKLPELERYRVWTL
ncbi:uncharacterized protein FOMMEDRAFT_31450 [Fomitiporia mediterranea MF3/22]|uniref:uncharacterized protein n=1 Tax=Fomitiporia mediterranea (strain MF3/22) TaxID=694068 RepID=UPI0004409109|nr:uncharacterized protein FOMMEDRAFT_31450 [Fomitiporia mediterranea MF3/22]EJC98858.1 hypothetical protein FOMMEDRAFT_31450 [Fomitiporia mediterranea MF3/22]